MSMHDGTSSVDILTIEAAANYQQVKNVLSFNGFETLNELLEAYEQVKTELKYAPCWCKHCKHCTTGVSPYDGENCYICGCEDGPYSGIEIEPLDTCNCCERKEEQDA